MTVAGSQLQTQLLLWGGDTEAGQWVTQTSTEPRGTGRGDGEPVKRAHVQRNSEGGKGAFHNISVLH